jgi:N-methylhydantoinase A
MQKLKLGIDVGGTFTDVVGIDESGHVYFAKTPSTPEDQSIGVINGIRRILQDIQSSPENVGSVAHGTTVATNMLLERTGAKTALITTQGFRDVLHIGRQNRPYLYDLHARRPKALIPRYLRTEAVERSLHTGEVELEIIEKDLEKTIQRLLKEDVKSIAICFLHSYANPENEHKAASVVKKTAPNIPVSISSDILPEFRDFERMNTTVINAYVQPGMDNYLSRLIGRLKESGVQAPLMIMQSSGGMMTDKVAASRSVHTLLSGPAGGALAAEFLANITEYKNIITGDLGGTSFDVAVIQDGKVAIANEGIIEGYPVKFPHIDITTIGAGGGSVAWIDTGGALRVGPRSAGAIPGPVCYCKGGDIPTVTDAHAVLGRIGNGLLGGEMKLDVNKARKAIQGKLANYLEMSVEEVAEGILRVANANMVRAIRVMTIEKGIDPRRFVIMPFGGAGALHAYALAEALEIGRVVIPVAPGNFSAFGLLAAPIRYDGSCTYRVHEKDCDPERMEYLYAQLDKQIREEMIRDKVSPDAVHFERTADIRYFGQAYELKIILPEGKISDSLKKQIIPDFHRLHEKFYGFKKEQNPVEFVALRLAVVGNTDNSKLYVIQKNIHIMDAKPDYERKVYFNGSWINAGVYQREKLKMGIKINGPAIIEEQGATTVIGPLNYAEIDSYMNIVIHPKKVFKEQEGS